MTIRVGNASALVAAGIGLSALTVSGSARAEWIQTASLERPTNLGGDGATFAERAVSCSGGTVLIGAPSEDDYAGAVYAFSGSNYAEVQRFVAPDPGSSDSIGGSLSVSGDTVIVGSSRIDGGSVRFFVREDGVWTHQQTILSEGDARAGSFGRDVVVRGDLAAVSSPKESGDTGRVYVYRRTDGVWAEEAQLSSSDPMNSDFFGLSLELDGDTLVASAPTNPFLDSDRGSVFVFSRTGTTWSEQARFDLTGQAESPPLLYFGASATLSGDTVVVRAYQGTDEPANDRLLVYERTGSAWQLTQTLFSEGDDAFGTDATLQGDRLFAYRTLGEETQLQEYQRGNGDWGPTQTFPPIESSGFALCGGTLVLTNAPTVLVYQDPSFTGEDPTLPPPTQGESGTAGNAGDTVAGGDTLGNGTEGQGNGTAGDNQGNDAEGGGCRLARAGAEPPPLGLGLLMLGALLMRRRKRRLGSGATAPRPRWFVTGPERFACAQVKSARHPALKRRGG